MSKKLLKQIIVTLVIITSLTISTFGADDITLPGTGFVLKP